MITFHRLSCFQICTAETNQLRFGSTQEERHASRLCAKFKLGVHHLTSMHPPPPHQHIRSLREHEGQPRHCHYMRWKLQSHGVRRHDPQLQCCPQDLERRQKKKDCSCSHVTSQSSGPFHFIALELKLFRQRPTSGFWRVPTVVYNALSGLWCSEN
jgi:hypothetical protein